MRNRRAILLLLVAIALATAANLMVYRGGSAVPVARRTALADLQGDVTRISLARKGDAETVLERDAAGGRIVEPFVGRADGQAVMKLIDALSITPIQDATSDSELLRLGRTRADFSLEDPVLRIRLRQESGDELAFGFGAPTATADGVYAESDDSAAVFVVPPEVLAAVDVPADGFRRRALFKSGVESVSKFDVKRNDGTVLEFSREGQGWRFREGAASTQKVVAFLTELLSASATSFVWPVGASNETDHASEALLTGYGLDPDGAITVTLKDFDGVDRQVSFGKDAGDGCVYALVQNGGAIVTIPGKLRDTAAQDAVLFTDSRLFPVDLRTASFFSIAAENVLYAFARDKGGVWGIESPIIAPADQATTESVLSRVLALTSADLVTAGGVAVSVATNGETVTVSRDSVLGRHTFEDLRSRELLRIDPTQVKRIVRTPNAREGAAATSVVYDRDRRAWNVENGGDDVTADLDGISVVLSAISPLQATRVEKLKVPAADLDDYGLDDPLLTVAVDQNAEELVRKNIIIGKRTRGGRFATIGSSDAVFVLSEDVVAKLSTAIVGK